MHLLHVFQAADYKNHQLQIKFKIFLADYLQVRVHPSAPT